MNYSLLFYLPPDDFRARTDPATREAFWAGFFPYYKAIQDAGILVTGAGLEPPDTAATLRMTGDQRYVQNGPYADTKEQLGGVIIINVPDLDTALDWASRYPPGHGSLVEVRPNIPPMPRDAR